VFNLIWITKNKTKALDFNQPWDEQITYDGKRRVVRMN
jgi:hypothetical protein